MPSYRICNNCWLFVSKTMFKKNNKNNLAFHYSTPEFQVQSVHGLNGFSKILPENLWGKTYFLNNGKLLFAFCLCWHLHWQRKVVGETLVPYHTQGTGTKPYSVIVVGLHHHVLTVNKEDPVSLKNVFRETITVILLNLDLFIISCMTKWAVRNIHHFCSRPKQNGCPKEKHWCNSLRAKLNELVAVFMDQHFYSKEQFTKCNYSDLGMRHTFLQNWRKYDSHFKGNNWQVFFSNNKIWGNITILKTCICHCSLTASQYLETVLMRSMVILTNVIC